MGSYRTGQVLMATWPVTNLSNTEILELQESEADTVDVYLIPNTSLLGTLINTTIEPFNDVRCGGRCTWRWTGLSSARSSAAE